MNYYYWSFYNSGITIDNRITTTRLDFLEKYDFKTFEIVLKLSNMTHKLNNK